MADIKKDLIYAAGTDNGAAGDKITTASGNTYYIPMKREQSMGLVVTNAGSSSANIVLKAGTEYKKSLGDNTIAVANGKTVVIPLYDSARYKIGSGEHAGTFAFTVSAALTVVPFVI